MGTIITLRAGILGLVLGTLLCASSKLDALKGAIASQEMVKIVQASYAYGAELRAGLSEDTQRRIYQEALVEGRQANPIPSLVNSLASLESALQSRNSELAYKWVVLISVYATRQEMANPRDPMPAFLMAQQKAEKDPSFINFYGLVVASNLARRFDVTIDAGQKALAKSASDPAATIRADGVHSIRMMMANAYWEMGQRELAGEFLLKSLDTGDKSWARYCPDVFVAEKMLRGNERLLVTEYLQKANAMPFPACKASIALWLSEINQGRTPALTLPPPPPLR